MLHSPPDGNPTQLIRYVLEIDNLRDDEALTQVRQQLTGLGFAVDRLEAGDPGQAEVAAAHGTNPGPEGIGRALAAIGCPLRAAHAQTS